MDRSAFVAHAKKTSHLPYWDGAGILASYKNKGNGKAMQAAYIAMNETMNIRVGSMKWAKSATAFGIR